LDYEVVDTDVLVVGAGGAGCRAAIEAARNNMDVTLLSKELFGKAHTTMAELGYNVALANVAPEDSWKWHFYDTLSGGAWINNQFLVEILAKEAVERVYDLENFGALFDRTSDGKLNQRMMGKTTYPRTVFAGDRTGHEMMTCLVDECRRLGIRVFDEFFASRLIKRQDEVSGATAIDIKSGDFVVFRAKATVLATGGSGRIYEVTSNARSDTGDGFAMGYLAGAELIDMEMVQFHPTAMVYPPSYRGVLVTEAVRGEGGILYNSQKERFMKRYNPKLMELAGRDEVARSIATEILEGRGTERGGVYLDVSHLPQEKIEKRLPSMLEQFLKVGVDIKKEPMEVAPTAHHFMGGLKIDTSAATTLKRLYAAGEVVGGVQGGNRLGGNALADTQVFGKKAGENASVFAKKASEPKLDRKQIRAEHERVLAPLQRKKGVSPTDLRNRLRSLMWNKVGIFRNGKDLAEAITAIGTWRRTAVPKLFVADERTRYNMEWIEALELENMLLVAEMVSRAALIREESRGAHFRRDYTKRDDDKWFANLVIRLEGKRMAFRREPCQTLYVKKPEVAFSEVAWP